LAPIALLAAVPFLGKLRRARRSNTTGHRGQIAVRFFGGKDGKEEEAGETAEAGELSEAAQARMEKLQEEIDELISTTEEKKATHERLKLEVKNFRDRTRSELAAARGKAAIPLVKELLPIADEFEYAKQNLKVESDSEKAVVEKFEALFAKMIGSWKELGVEKLSSVGEDFNPELHEAVSMIPSEEYKEEVVCNELRAGWAMKAPGSDELQVLRPSLVCVSAGPGPS